ncbi:MAG: hypothetical protein U1F66_08090 [bacterium]
MTPPRPPVSASKSPSSDAPEETPELKTARKSLDKAAYERNRLDLAHKKAVADHGEDSPITKAAKEALNQAQSLVESLQGELRRLLRLPKASGPALAKPPTKAAKPAEKPAPAPAEAPSKPVALRGEVLIRKTLVREIKIDSNLHRLLEEIRKEPRPRGAYMEYMEMMKRLPVEKPPVK